MINNQGQTGLEFHLRIREGLIQLDEGDLPATGQLEITTISTEHSQELVGAPPWGNNIDIKMIRYRSASDGVEMLEDVDFAFTLEVEPIFEKI